VTYIATPHAYYCARPTCGDPIFDSIAPQVTAPITFAFSKPIYQIVVGVGGAWLCSGDYGSITVHNRKNTAVEQRAISISYPEDCGSDNITGSGMDSLQFPGGITSLVITPPQPWSWTAVVDTQGRLDTGYVTAAYAFSFYDQRPPTAASCLTGDELLDQQAMRDLLAVIWSGSKPDSLPARRRELRGFLFEQDSTGNLVSGTYPDTTINPPLDTLMDTPCQSVGVPSGPLLGIPVAGGHSHPFAPGASLPIQACGLQPGYVYNYDVKKYGGPSKADILRIADWVIPQYIIDSVNIYVAPLGTDTLNALTKVKKYPRVDPTGCTRP
jgi:hypothetical protein